MRLTCGMGLPLWVCDMTEMLVRMIREYGTGIERLRGAESAQIRGFLQSAQSKNWQKMEKEISSLGEIPGGLYVFIGEVGSAAEGDTLRLGSEDYLLRQLDTVYFGDQAAYCWGLCSRMGREDTWGM